MKPSQLLFNIHRSKTTQKSNTKTQIDSAIGRKDKPAVQMNNAIRKRVIAIESQKKSHDPHLKNLYLSVLRLSSLMTSLFIFWRFRFCRNATVRKAAKSIAKPKIEILINGGVDSGRLNMFATKRPPTTTSTAGICHVNESRCRQSSDVSSYSNLISSCTEIESSA